MIIVEYKLLEIQIKMEIIMKVYHMDNWFFLNTKEDILTNKFDTYN